MRKILGIICVSSFVWVFLFSSVIIWILNIYGVPENILNAINALLSIVGFASFGLTGIGIYLLATNKNVDLYIHNENQVIYAGFWIRFLTFFIDYLLGYLIIPTFFTLYFWFKDAQTLGDKMLGIKVYTIRGGNLVKPSGLQLFFYPFIKVLNVFTFFVGYLMIGFTKRKQGLHNLINNTVVVKINPNNAELQKSNYQEL